MKKSIFRKILNKKELALMPRAFDVVGDLLLFSEFPEKLKKKEKKIGEALITHMKNVTVVLKKMRKYSGKHRLPRYKILAGERRKETTHTESGCRFRLHVEKAYFSSRLSTERLRIAQLIGEGESVLVMFSGIATYPIVIRKNSEAEEIVGVEINPEAHHYALGNLVLNKITNISLLLGDVRKILPKMEDTFDRIVMPLPKTGEEFLPLALARIKDSGVIHYYCFAKEKEIKNVERKVTALCKHEHKECTIQKVTKCGQASPRVYRVCVDIRIN